MTSLKTDPQKTDNPQEKMRYHQSLTALLFTFIYTYIRRQITITCKLFKNTIELSEILDLIRELEKNISLYIQQQ